MQFKESIRVTETVAFVEAEGTITQVKAKYTRSFPFNDFQFSINENGLPFQITSRTPF